MAVCIRCGSGKMYKNRRRRVYICKLHGVMRKIPPQQTTFIQKETNERIGTDEVHRVPE